MPRTHNPATDDFHVVTLVTTDRRAAALADAVRAATGVEPVTLTKPGARRAWLDLYFTTPAAAARAQRAWTGRPGVRAVGRRVCRPRDWQHFWRRHFAVRAVGRLLLTPAWITPTAAQRRGRKVIRIEPGLSFGTGDHFTTRVCLELLDAARREAPIPSLLDAGTGSGILALAAVKLGVPRVAGFDNDPQAIEQARANLRLNRAASAVRLFVHDLARRPPPGRWHTVCANILSSVLMETAPALDAAAQRQLLLSGIRESEADAVAAAYLELGWEEIARDGDGIWCGLRLRRAGRRKCRLPIPRGRCKLAGL